MNGHALQVCLCALSLAAGGGCASVGPYIGPRPLPNRPFPETAETGLSLTLGEVVSRALSCSPDLASLRSEVDVAREEAEVAGDIRDPRVQAGWGHTRSRATRWGSSLSSGYGRENGIETEMSTGTETENRVTTPPYGAPVRESTSETVSQSTTLSRSSERSAAQAFSVEGGNDRSARDAWNVDVSLYPPNPWTYSAQRNAARATAYALTAELHQAQVDLAAEVASLFSELLYMEEAARIETDLSASYAAALQASRELFDQGLISVADDLRVHRQQLAAASKRQSTVRKLEDTRQALAALAGVPAENLRPETNGWSAWPLEIAEVAPARLVTEAQSRRGDVAASQWRLAAARAGRREALSLRMPWLCEVELAYGERTGDSRAHRWSEGASRETDAGRADATQTGGQVRDATETESGAVETSHGTSESVETSIARHTSTQTQTSRGEEETLVEERGDEWYVGVAFSIPFFSWRKSGVRARAVECARAAETLESARQASVRRVLDAIARFRRSRAARAEHEHEAALARAYVERGRRELEAGGTMLPAERCALEAALLELRRTEAELEHNHRLAGIALQAALGMVAGVPAPHAP
ncbi:MAG: TolC family protein [Kiritimatiellae bacterium]|nr:TolC family protein [Kiritimatiellia bacterium]